MLKIGGAKLHEPFDIAIADGVTFKCRPIEIADIVIARRAYFSAGTKADDAETKLAIAGIAFSTALARRVVVGWEGIGDEKGKPLPVSPANVEAAMGEFQVWQGFETNYVQPQLSGLNEKNASSPSQTGTTGARTKAKATARTATAKTRSLNGANPAHI